MSKCSLFRCHPLSRDIAQLWVTPKALPIWNRLSYLLFPASALMMIMLMALVMGWGGLTIIGRNQLRKLMLALTGLFVFHWLVLEFPLIHSRAVLKPNAGQRRLMHFYCTTSCEAPSKAPTDVRACRNHLGSELQRLLDSVKHSNRAPPESCISSIIWFSRDNLYRPVLLKQHHLFDLNSYISVL